MSGSCEFSNPDNDYSVYDYDYHYDYDFADEDKEQCLQTCLQKSKVFPHAVGCYLQKSSGLCIFLKTGTIVGSSGSSDSDTCWKFHEGNTLCECSISTWIAKRIMESAKMIYLFMYCILNFRFRIPLYYN